MEFIKKINNRTSADGIVFGSLLLLYRAVRTVRSRLFGWVLGAERLDIGIGCHIKGVRHMRLGADVSIFRNMWLEAVTRHHGQHYAPAIRIGDRVSFSNNVHISCIDRIDIGDDVLVGSNVHISDHSHGSYSGAASSAPATAPARRALGTQGPVVIGKNVWICDNVVIIGPAHIGDGAVIGANSVVRGEVAPASMVVGAPARIIKQFNPHTQQWEKVAPASKEGQASGAVQ